MPVDKTRYPHNWPKVSRLIRRIAGNRCEWCGVENHTPLKSGATYKKGKRKGQPCLVILTVAHLGVSYADGKPGDPHDKHDIRRENLAALCQKCHLGHDLPEHIENRKRNRKKAAMAAGQLLLEGDTP